MATYLPNVKDYIPNTETFTPDYKFLSDVLDIRQDRYNTNYKHMNNLYGSVVHADLSRANNKSTRDQYTEHLIPKMKQIAGLDLSLMENVDAAKALFKPFYENKFLVRDLVYTKEYQKQNARGLALLNSNDPVERRKHWAGAEKFLQFKMDDFVNATDEESMKKPLPKWVDKMDLITDGIAALKELDMNIEDVRFTPNGQWKITQKNGSLLRAQPTGILNAEGNMTYTDPAGDYIKAVILQDPKMLDYYRTKSYVEGRTWSEDNQEQYGGVDAALDVWINNTIDKYTIEGQKAIDDLSTREVDQKVKKQHWEQYKKRNGLINASQEEMEWLSTLGELESIKKAKAALTKNYNDVTKKNMGPNEQLTKAYIAHMSYLIAVDVDKAANAYANKDAKTEWSETKSYLEKVKQSNRKAMEKIKQENKVKNILLKNSLENLQVTTDPDQHSFPGSGEANAAGFGLDEDNDEVKTLYTINENNVKRDAIELTEIELSMFNQIVQYYNQWNAATGAPVTTEELFAQILPPVIMDSPMGGEVAAGMGLDPDVLASFNNAWDDVAQKSGIKNWDQLKEDLDKGNSKNVNILYDKMITEVNGFDGTNGWLADYKETVNNVTRLDEILNGKQLMINESRKKQAKANKAAYDLVVTNDSGGQKFQELLDEYGINIFDEDFNYKNETDFVKDFIDGVKFETIEIKGAGTQIAMSTPGDWSYSINNPAADIKATNLKPKSDEFLITYGLRTEVQSKYINEDGSPKGEMSVMETLKDIYSIKSIKKDILNTPQNHGTTGFDIGGIGYKFDEVKATKQAKEQYQLLTASINAVQEKGTGPDDSFPVFNADAWYEGSEQYGAGSTITGYSGGNMDIANTPAQNKGEYQWGQFLSNYLENNGVMYVKQGDQSASFVDLTSDPNAVQLLKQLYLSTHSNDKSDKSKESRLKADIRYNENIGGRMLANLDGDPGQDWSGVVIQLDEKFTKAYMDPIVNSTGTNDTEGLTDNTLTIIWPKGEFFNQSDSQNQPRHHYEDYLQAGVPVIVERKGAGKVIFRNIYEEGNVINTIQAERYVKRWDANLHQYVDEPVDVIQITRGEQDFKTWRDLEINTIQFLLDEQTINEDLKAADKGYNATK